MNWLDFFASIFASIASVAWPAAVVASVWIFRREIALMLPHLRLKHKETELSFRLEQAENIAGELPSEQITSSSTSSDEELVRFEKLASVSPSTAVTTQRRDFERQLRQAGGRAGIAFYDKLAPLMIAKQLHKNGHVGSEALAVIDELIKVGQLASDGDEFGLVSPADALRYLDLKNLVVGLLKAVPKTPLE